MSSLSYPVARLLPTGGSSVALVAVQNASLAQYRSTRYWASSQWHKDVYGISKYDKKTGENRWVTPPMSPEQACERYHERLQKLKGSDSLVKLREQRDQRRAEKAAREEAWEEDKDEKERRAATLTGTDFEKQKERFDEDHKGSVSRFNQFIVNSQIDDESQARRFDERMSQSLYKVKMLAEDGSVNEKAGEALKAEVERVTKAAPRLGAHARFAETETENVEDEVYADKELVRDLPKRRNKHRLESRLVVKRAPSPDPDEEEVDSGDDDVASSPSFSTKKQRV